MLKPRAHVIGDISDLNLFPIEKGTERLMAAPRSSWLWTSGGQLVTIGANRAQEVSRGGGNAGAGVATLRCSSVWR